MAAMYGVYHGVDGLSNISSRVYGLTTLLKQNLIDLGYEVETNNHFDTLVVKGDDLFE